MTVEPTSPALPPVTRGRPRSTSISNGSPCPPPGPPPPLLNFVDPHPPVHWTSPHRATLVHGSYTGEIVSPVPIAAGGLGRMGRHRRNMSVSPTGEEGDPKSRVESPSTRDEVHKGSPVERVGGTPAMRIPTKHHPGHPGRSASSGSSPKSPQSPSFPPSLTGHSNPSSPLSHGLEYHPHTAFPSSHAALLSGIRSHALPHQVLMDHDGSMSHSRSPTLSTLPQSPPFGPTSSSQPFPAPQEGRPVSPDFDGLPHSWDIELAMGLEPSGEPRLPLPGAFETVPLLPPFSETGVSAAGGIGASLSEAAATTGRKRSTSFGHQSSPPSAAMAFIESEQVSPFGQCDIRSPPPKLPRPASPPPLQLPLSPPLPPCASPPLPPTLAPPPTIPLLAPTLTPPVTRNRSRSFTTERNFAPNPPPLQSLPPTLPPASTSVQLSPPPPPLPITEPAVIPLFELDLSLIPTDDSSEPSLKPPPSPHGANIALPPPHVAPAPLPPHLGGPPLHTAPPKRRSSKTARAHATSAALASKLNALVGTEHVPKKHSPLASPSVSSNENSDSDESEGEEDEGDEEGEMELDERSLSPCGPPEHQEIASYLSLMTQDDLPLRAKYQELDDPSTASFDAVVSNGPENDRAEEGIGGTNLIVSEEEPASILILVDSNESDLGGLGFMDVDAPSSLGLESSEEAFEEAESADEGEAIAIDEESLSALERIFICAKSEVAEERARVAHHLPEWLCLVDICEAVEYVLPLLAGLATDTEEIVKEVFAPQLDSIMWHFFSRCPLLELEQSTDGQEPIEAVSPSGSPVPSRYSAPPLPSVTSTSPTSTHFPSDDSGGTLPSTSKTSPSNTEVSDVPRISSTTFTSLLGALLTDQSTMVAKATQASLVRFLCLLKGKPIPGESSRDSSPFNDLESEPIPFHRTEFASLVHPRSPYHLNAEARRLLEDEFLTGIVLGLARLDEDEREGEKSVAGSEGGFPSASARRASSSVQSEEGQQPPSLFLSPEEEVLDVNEAWLSSSPESTTALPVPESWDAEPLVSFFDDALDRTDSTQFSMEGVPNLAASPLSPADPMVYSNFSPDLRGDEESSLGKLVSMSLIAAIAAADCLEPEVLMQQILPEVDRMKSEPMFYVRKEAMHALGCLARTLPLEVFEVAVLPLHATFARDSLWHVRRAACLALPSICKRLSPELLRTEVITNIKTFSADPSRNVRSGALEVCGELIHLFHGDAGGVPQELLAFFLGQVAPPLADPYDSVFAPLQSALDSPSETFYGSPPSWAPTTSLFATSKDPDRPVMCAFNFPAVALTLGSESWHLLQSYYSTLSNSKGDKVRQSLASSLHEIAKIIGPKQADDSLLEPFSWYIRDLDHIQGAVLENISTLLRALTPEGAKEALTMLRTEWDGIKTWRRREAVAKELGGLGQYLIGIGAVEEMLRTLARGFKDKVASVREAAVEALPAIFAATDLYPSARNNLLAFLAVFSEDSGYRNRVTYTAAALAAVRGGISRETFEAYFVNTLSRLSRDGVANVRIGVARAINHACQAEYLYAEDSSRGPIHDILQNLSHAHDRDVNDLIASFYRSDSPPTPTVPLAGSRPRGQSLSMFDDATPLPRLHRTQRYGIIDDDEEEDDRSDSDRMDDIPLSRFPSDQSHAADDGDLAIEVDYAMEDGDIEMVDEGSEPSPRLATRELSEDEDSFVEVSRM